MHKHTNQRQRENNLKPSPILSNPRLRVPKTGDSAQLSIAALSSGYHRSLLSGGANSVSHKSMSQMEDQEVPQLDAESVAVLFKKIQQKQTNINDLVDRIKQNLKVKELLVAERQKAKANQTNAERMRNVEMTALSILERPPCADVFFDNHGSLDTEED